MLFQRSFCGIWAEMILSKSDAARALLLRYCKTKEPSISGFDPAYEGSNPAIQRRSFGPHLGLNAEGLRSCGMCWSIFRNPTISFPELRDANSGQGLIYIEVPCFDWICEKRAWFDIFYEHVNYFRLTDFSRMFGRIIASGSEFLGQYLYVVADLATLRAPEFDAKNPVAFPADFTKDFPALISDRKNSEPLIVWGGASKGVNFSLFCERAGHPVDVVIDINPAKQGRFLPATGIKVMSPDEGLKGLPEGATIYVMNPNYIEEIKQMSRNAFTYVAVGHD